MQSDKCSLCGKNKQSANVFVEVNLEVFPKYVRADGVLESMNGLWKKTTECFCEECFTKYANVLESFYQANLR